MVSMKNTVRRKKLQFKFIQRILSKMTVLLVFFFSACDFTSKIGDERMVFNDTLTVVASAYNSLAGQTEGDPFITAWGDTLAPGTRSIAVSRDLIPKGLDHATPVKIKGFEGIFIVNDKMHPRWRNKIDIYMGLDQDKAIQWGRRKVEIYFPSSRSSEE